MAQRIAVIDPNTATGEARQLFDDLKLKIGRIPNLLKTMATSPAALRGYMGLEDALAAGLLSPQLRQQIALAVAEANRCDYCLSAHTAIGKMVGLDENDLAAARQSKADDEKTEAALSFAHKLVISRGQVDETDVQRARDAGYSDGEIVEIIANVALQTFSNYFNAVAQTDIDYPKLPVRG